MRKDMDNALKGLVLAAGVVLTCMILGLGFYIAREAKATASVSANRLTQYRAQLEEGSLLNYDGLTVSGNEVVNLTKRLVGSYSEGKEAPIIVTIRTKKSSWIYRNRTNTSKLRDSTSERYIPPQSEFVVHIGQDDNDVIISVTLQEN